MKKKFIFVMIIATISLTGCAKTLDLSEDKTNMVSEYMANLLLKYDKHFEEKLIYQVPVEEDIVGTDATQSQATNSSDTSSNTELNQDTVINTTTTNQTVSDSESDNNGSISVDGKESSKEVQYVDLNTVMGIDGFEISYTGYSLLDSYPTESSDSVVTLNASDNKKLLVVEFNIKNVTAKKKTINLMDKDVIYALGSETNEVESEITLLPEDIHYVSSKVNAKALEKAVVIFEVTKDYKVNGANVYITNKDKTAKVNIK